MHLKNYTNQTKIKFIVTSEAVKWSAACEPCSSSSLWVQHLHVVKASLSCLLPLSLILFDSPVWQLMSRIKRGGGEVQSSRTYCGTASLMCCQGETVTQQPHNSSLVLIDFILPELRVLSLSLMTFRINWKPRIPFQTCSPGTLGLKVDELNSKVDQCLTTQLN